ncbi:phytanoyl-CoA dioxygenase family protein [Propionibacteriaceae bacterium Y2011]
MTTPTITTDHRLSSADHAFFDRNGFVKLRGALDPAELTHFDPVITDKVIELNDQDVPLTERDTYGKAFLQVSNLWRTDAEVERFVRSPDLARLAAELLGVRSVRLYHDQALYKEPSGGLTPWHADQYYWPFTTDRCITAWIPLQDTPVELGPLSFAAGSHQVDLGRTLPISDESEAQIAEQLVERGYVVEESPYALGDVSFHLGWTFHHAGANLSDQPRRVMTIIYVDADMIIAEPANDNQVADLATWLPGCRPGDVVASPLNPVLYPVD